MAVYNAEEYLPRSIESIMTQSFGDWELHIYDDGSTDRSLEICRVYELADDRITVHHSPLNQGPAFARQQALSFIDSEWLGWVDADDYLEPHALDSMLAWLSEHPEFDMAYSGYVDTDANGRILGLGSRCHIPYSPERLLTDLMVFHFSLMKTKDYRRVGGIDHGFVSAEDYDFFLRASEILSIGHNPAVLYRYRRHPASVSSQQPEAQIQASRRAIEQALNRRGMSQTHRLSPYPDFRIDRIEPSVDAPADH